MLACETLNIDIPFSKSKKLLGNFPVENNRKCDGYINNLITCALDRNKTWK